jgi:anti-sigma regulatory factor (Ser/Thr protein kinase)
VTFLPDKEWYIRPARTIAGWARMVSASMAGGRRRSRLIGEVRFGSADGHRSWVRAESAINRVLAGLPARLVCPYDVGRLPRQLIDDGRRTHPLILNGGCRDNPGYLPPERVLADIAEPPFPVAGTPAIEVPIGDTVSPLRDLVRERGTAGGWLSADGLDDLVLALSEVVTNGLRHGDGRRLLRVWASTDAVVCEVTDDGADPPGVLAGYLPPTPGAAGGMGLWLVHQICDSLSIDTSDGHTRVRFAIRAR